MLATGRISSTQGTQNTAVGFVATQIKAFKFKKTNLDVSASLIPAITDAGRVHFNANAVYYIKIVQRSLVELFVLRKLGHSPSSNTLEERLRHQFRTQLDLRQPMTRILAPRLLC